MISKTIAATFVTTALLSAPVSALTITSVFGEWRDFSTVNGPAEGEGTQDVSWGGSATGAAKNVYSFRSKSTSIDTKIDESFHLGSFAHRNNPTFPDGALLKSANLAVSFMVEGSSNTFKSVFKFNHNEIQDDLTICGNGALSSAAVNANGCADIVSLSLNPGASQPFSLNGRDYLLNVNGFAPTGGGQTSVLKQLLTKEKDDTSADLEASFLLVSDPGNSGDGSGSNTSPSTDPTDPQSVDTSPSEVPLPASGLLLIGGVAALMLRRRKS